MDTGRNLPSAFVTTASGSASTQDHDFRGPPVPKQIAPQPTAKVPTVVVTMDTSIPVPKVISAVVHDAPQVQPTTTTPKASTPVKEEPKDDKTAYTEPALTETVLLHQDPGCLIKRPIYGSYGYSICATYFDPATGEGISQTGPQWSTTSRQQMQKRTLCKDPLIDLMILLMTS